mgnify:CR=1 FL=1|tara:strand:- start:65 stop:1369 length:1305 start_codon:yes stop_codon:yes gene_type:complete
MAITILDDLPEFLKNFLIGRGIKPPVDPNAVPVSSGLVPVLPKRRVVPENAYTSGDIDVDPPANIPFDSSYFSNLLGIGGLFGGSENTSPIPSDFEDKTTWQGNPMDNVGLMKPEAYQNLRGFLKPELRGALNQAAFASWNDPANYAPYLANLGRDTDPNSATKNYIDKTQSSLSDFGSRLSNQFMEPFHSPYISDERKIGYGVSKIIPSLMGGLAPVLGLFGAIGQAMGAYHPLNAAKDSNIFMDPLTDVSTWDSLSPGAGGFQTGSLNIDNQLANLAKENPDQWLDTPYGYITASDLNKANEAGLFDSVIGTLDDTELAVGFRDPNSWAQRVDYGVSLPQDRGFQEVAPFGFTNQQALQDFENTRSGEFLNQAGIIGEVLGDTSYETIQNIAEGLATGDDSAFDDAYADSFSDTTEGSEDSSIDDFGGEGWF